MAVAFSVMLQSQTAHLGFLEQWGLQARLRRSRHDAGRCRPGGARVDISCGEFRDVLIEVAKQGESSRGLA